VEAIINDLLAVGLVHAGDLDDVVAGPGRGAKVEAEDLAAPRRLELLDLVELLDPRLDLGGAPGLGLEALDEADLLGQHRLLALVLGLLLGLAERALLLVEVEVARIGGELAAVDLEDLGDDAVQELA